MDYEELENSFTVGKQPKLEIDNIRGSVTIKPGINEQIRVTAIKHMNSGNEEHTDISIEQDDDGTVRAVSKWHKSNGSFWNRSRPIKVDFVIETPASSNVSVRTVSASAAISGLEGDCSVKSVSGRIELEQLSGDLNIRSVSGKIIGKMLKGEGYFNSVSGSVIIRDSELATFACKTVSGKTLIETPIGEGPYSFQSVSGNATLMTAKDSPLSLVAKSLSGRFKTSLETSQYTRQSGRTRASLNGGGVMVKMKSVSGNFYVVSSEDDQPRSLRVDRLTGEERMSILTKLQDGDLSLDEARAKLS